MISIVVPAHNEANVIARSLAAMTDGARASELEIVVIANGCTDNTADVARGFGPPVVVIETPVGSKIHALNLGDQTAGGFPRIYVDADVLLPITAIRQLANALAGDTTLAAAPRPRIDLTGCGWPVRAFYNINQRMPSSAEGIGGSGVYALSRTGRTRFAEFPKLTADDGFVRLQFSPHERRTLTDCDSTVHAPKTLRDLIAIKTRSHFGSYELQRMLPDKWIGNRGPGNRQAILKLARSPLLWPHLAVYLYVKLVARARARRKLRAGIHNVWERDETSRLAADPSARPAHAVGGNS